MKVDGVEVRLEHTKVELRDDVLALLESARCALTLEDIHADVQNLPITRCEKRRIVAIERVDFELAELLRAGTIVCRDGAYVMKRNSEPTPKEKKAKKPAPPDLQRSLF